MFLVFFVGLIATQLVGAQSNYFYNQPFSLSGHNADTGLCYYAEPESIYDALDNTVYITIVVLSGRVDFYVLTASEYSQFTNGISHSKASSCTTVAPQSWESKVESIGFTYSGKYLPPDNAYHYFVLYNPYPADTNGLCGLAWANAQPAATSVYYPPPPTTAYSYEPFISTSESVGQGTLQTFFPTDPGSVLVIAVVVALIIGAVIYFWPISGRAKSKQAKLDSVLSQQPTAKPEPEPQPSAKQAKNVKSEAGISAPTSTKVSPDMMFCKECGSRISRDSKFCKECGAKQT